MTLGDGGFVLSFANAGFLISPNLGGLIYGKLAANAVFLAMGVIVMIDIILGPGRGKKPVQNSSIYPRVTIDNL